MDKKQAQQEILRRLHIYMIQFNLKFSERLLNARIKLLDYHSGELSKQELIRMITLDEDGNLLSEPLKCNYAIHEEEFYFQHVLKYQQALNQSTEIVNCYGGNK